MTDVQMIQAKMMAGDGEGLTDLIKAALDEGISAAEILNSILIPGMAFVGEQMENGEKFIPEVLMAAQTMGGAVEFLKPLLGTQESRQSGKVVVGTVKGDLHDIGKNLVCMMMESTGFEMVDLGVDVEPAQFVEAIKNTNCDIISLSALLATTLGMIKRTVEAITEGGYRDKVKIIIGGAPVTMAFSEAVAAEGYAGDAGSASRLAKTLLQ